jgi:putative endonuclease
LDLVLRDRDTLVFVEVKTFERADLPGGPAIQVTPAKQKRVARAATGWLTLHGLGREYCRFDVVAVRLSAFEGGSPVLEHIKGAFTL